jgi:hypothetical protein
MGDNIEIQFRGGNPKKWHSGKMRIQDADCLQLTGLVIVLFGFRLAQSR